MINAKQFFLIRIIGFFNVIVAIIAIFAHDFVLKTLYFRNFDDPLLLSYHIILFGTVLILGLGLLRTGFLKIREPSLLFVVGFGKLFTVLIWMTQWINDYATDKIIIPVSLDLIFSLILFSIIREGQIKDLTPS